MSGGMNQPIRPNLANLLNPLDEHVMTDVSPYEEAFELVEETTSISLDTHVVDANTNHIPPASIKDKAKARQIQLKQSSHFASDDSNEYETEDDSQLMKKGEGQKPVSDFIMEGKGGIAEWCI
ncbi:hypothetical protein APHAL10511_004236 [Amanita phalloides]|nr:hypothetical protein APHAL10511_004236 [Amanita phalloides]